MPKMTLAEARGVLGWTQTKLATEAAAGVSTINDLENGANKNPGYALVMRIIGALRAGGLVGLNPEDVFPVPAPKGGKVA